MRGAVQYLLVIIILTSVTSHLVIDDFTSPEPLEPLEFNSYEDKIIFLGQKIDNTKGVQDIYLYNIATERITKLTENESNPRDLDIYENYALWIIDSADSVNLELINLSDYSISVVDTSPYISFAHIFENNVIWFERGVNEIYGNISVYNIKSKNKEVIAYDVYGNPDIFENNVVWVGKNLEIHLFDMDSKNILEITNETYNDWTSFYTEKPILKREPKMSSDLIIWLDYRHDENYEIGTWTNASLYQYNISTGVEEFITNNISDLSEFDIYDESIIWNYNKNIILYNTNSKIADCLTQNDDDSVYYHSPTITGNNALWKEVNESAQFGKSDLIHYYNLSSGIDTTIVLELISEYEYLKVIPFLIITVGLVTVVVINKKKSNIKE